ncbi:MAG: hypothetical protein GF375_05720, partial [Candidatus Omnitrophica bacterium]|nr:hypothetical protein [Candidatus Omnitrophota bacterium]
MKNPKKTPLYPRHLASRAKMINFSGWYMPLEYKSSLEEAKMTRLHCGIFDVSHMGQLVLRGEASENFLQELTPNDVSLLEPGEMQYNLFLNERGGVIDDFIVSRMQIGFLCIVNASNKDKVLDWLCSRKKKNVDIEDLSSDSALISVQGPESYYVVGKVFGDRASCLKYMSFIEMTDPLKVLISRSGYT